MSLHNFLLPPEWAKQSGVLLTWPHRESIWLETLPNIDAVFVEITYHIAKREKVLIACFDHHHQEYIRKHLHNAGVDFSRIKIFIARSNDIWVRDHGPITVLENGQPKLLDFKFNGWGGKYPAEYDNELTRTLSSQAAFAKTPVMSIDMVLEGGSIEVDGQGTLLTTRSCLLAKTRNPQLSQTQIEQQLKDLLGIKRILWLDHGYLTGDDTDGHIDTLARFVDEHTICYMTSSDQNDEHYLSFKAMEKQLESFVDYSGQPYRLIPLPFPKPCFADLDGRRVPASYANFLIINDAVLVPTYDDPTDKDVVAILGDCFSNREIIPIPSLPVIQWNGSLHCMTMQLPLGVL